MLRTVRNLILLLAVVLGLTARGFAADTLLVITGAEKQVSGAWDTGTITISFTDSAGINYAESVIYGQFSTPASIASEFGAKFTNAYLSLPGDKLCAHAVGAVIYFHFKGTDTPSLPTITDSSPSFSVGTESWQSAPVSSRTSPPISWAIPASIPYGTLYSSLPAYANTDGYAGIITFPAAAGTALTTLGSQTVAYNFIPADHADYNSVTGTIQLNVVRAAPTIAWNPPTPITQGTALSSIQLSATQLPTSTVPSLAGSFAYTMAGGTVVTTGTILAAGSYALTATFTPTNTTDYAPATTEVLLTVNKIAPTITWATPASITDSTALSATQLNATCSVACTYVYSPAAGAKLAPGEQLLTVTATPTNSTEYAPVTATVPITVVSGATYDTGSLTLTVNPGAYQATYTYGASDTPSTIAAGLAVAASNSSSFSSALTATAVDDTLYIQATSTGTASDYSYAVQTTYNTTAFAQPSFQATPPSGSLDGGAASAASGTPIYSYAVPSNGYDRDGNLVYSVDSVMGDWSFQYDSLNRLVGSSDTPPYGTTAVTGVSPDYCWTYDAFGNRTAQAGSTSAFTNAAGSPCATSGTLINNWASYNANNQITGTPNAPSGPVYDPSGAGYILNDGVNRYLYDAEGRICAVASSPMAGIVAYTGYLYDADGTRVAKGSITAWTCDPTKNGFSTINDYVLGLGGEQITEMGIDSTAGSSTKTLAWQHANIWAGGKLLGTYDKDGLHFYLDDPLGTRRAQTDWTGNLEQTCSSLPYGDNLNCSGGNLLVPTEHHFTGKERDIESGNDYFAARYYSSSMGRFMSPDWSAKAEPVPYANLNDPQSLNLYAYVNNNPLSKADRDGHCDWCQKVVNKGRGNGWKTDEEVFTKGWNHDVALKITKKELGDMRDTYEYTYTPYKIKDGRLQGPLLSNPDGRKPKVALWESFNIPGEKSYKEMSQKGGAEGHAVDHISTGSVPWLNQHWFVNGERVQVFLREDSTTRKAMLTWQTHVDRNEEGPPVISGKPSN